MPSTISRPRSRRVAFTFATACLTVLAVELILRLVLLFVRHETWLADAQWISLNSRSPASSVGVAHPYVGTAHEPREGRVNGNLPVNRLGFPGASEPLQRRGPERFLVAVTGGSTARQFCQHGADRLREALRSAPQLAQRDIQVVGFAMDGSKQPQQLAAINYALALGGEFDAIINLDGFNELVVAKMNVDQGVFAAYPQAWPYALPHVADPADQPDALQFIEIGAMRRRNARSLTDSWFRHSALRQTFWKLRDAQLDREQYALAATVAADPDRRDFRLHGPQESFADEDEMYRQFAAIWRNSSRQLHDVATGRGSIYLHFLQPNVYVGAKPFAPEEATASDERYGPTIMRGYPLLRDMGRTLLEGGVRFRDLSAMFDATSEEVYLDDCHLNPHGYKLLAERFAADVLEALSNATESGPPL